MSIVHEIVGLAPQEFEQLLREQGSVSGMLEPRMHRHPLLGITHAHGPTEEAARTPHTHHPKVEWDSTPVPLP